MPFPHAGPAEVPLPGNTIHGVKPTSELTLAYDYNQLYLRDAAHELSADGNDYLDALDAATRAGLTVGAAAGVVDVLMPRQENFSAGLDVSIEESAPSLIETADHIVEFDLTSSGRIRLEGSGGSGEVAVEVPPGDYRARLSGIRLRCRSELVVRRPRLSRGSLPPRTLARSRTDVSGRAETLARLRRPAVTNPRVIPARWPSRAGSLDAPSQVVSR